jgi:hypothetical protein
MLDLLYFNVFPEQLRGQFLVGGIENRFHALAHGKQLTDGFHVGSCSTDRLWHSTPPVGRSFTNSCDVGLSRYFTPSIAYRSTVTISGPCRLSSARRSWKGSSRATRGFCIRTMLTATPQPSSGSCASRTWRASLPG